MKKMGVSRKGTQALNRMNMKVWQLGVDDEVERRWQDESKKGPPSKPVPKPKEEDQQEDPRYFKKLSSKDDAEKAMADYYRGLVRSNPPYRHKHWLYQIPGQGGYGNSGAGNGRNGAYSVDWSFDEYSNHYNNLQQTGQFYPSYPGQNLYQYYQPTPMPIYSPNPYMNGGGFYNPGFPPGFY